MGRKKTSKPKVKVVKKKKKVFSLQSLGKKFLYFTIFFGVFSLAVTAIFGFLPQQYKQTLPCANSISCINNLSGKVTSDTHGTFMGNKITAPNTDYFAQADKFTNVLGEQTGTGPKHVYIDLSAQRLYAFQGNQLMYNFSVSSGKWNLTPTGTFYIWIKLQATRMTGGEGGSYYDLPNVPWTMYFYNAKIGKSQGYSLHGAYWHYNFGHAMSHGCVNIEPANAKLLYDWADPPTTGYTTYATPTNQGTPVTIYGTTPNQDLLGTYFYNNNISYDAGSAM